MDKIEFNKIINNRELYETNNHLIRRFYQKYKSYLLKLGYDYQDLQQDIWIRIWDKTLKKYAFKDEKHLKCLITKKIKWELYYFRLRKLNLSDEEIKRNWRNQKFFSATNRNLTKKHFPNKLDENLYVNFNKLYPSITNNSSEELNIKLILDSLEEREKIIVYERFFKNEKWKNIAKELEISVSYTVMLYDKILIKLKKLFKREE